MIFQDPPVRFHVSWWEGKRFTFWDYGPKQDQKVKKSVLGNGLEELFEKTCSQITAALPTSVMIVQGMASDTAKEPCAKEPDAGMPTEILTEAELLLRFSDFLKASMCGNPQVDAGKLVPTKTCGPTRHGHSDLEEEAPLASLRHWRQQHAGARRCGFCPPFSLYRKPAGRLLNISALHAALKLISRFARAPTHAGQENRSSQS